MRPMLIEQCRFGYIRVAGKDYHSDIIITADAVHSNWWRKAGHSLCLEDLELVLAAKPEILVVGTGQYGAMQIPSRTRVGLAEQSIELTAALTPQACRIFNQLREQGKNLAGAFHLTC